MEPRKHEHKPHPQPEANCLSKLFFSWTSGLSVLASKRSLAETDLYDVLSEDTSIKLSNTLSRHWEKELYRWKTGGRPSLGRALLHCYLSAILPLNVVFFFVEVFRVSQAVFLGWVLSYFEEDSDVDWFLAYMYALGWSLSYILTTVLENIALHRSLYTGLRIRVALTSVIYRKILRLSQYSIHEGSRSDIVRLLSTDANKLDQLCQAMAYIWLSPLQGLCTVVTLWAVVGMGPFSLVVVIFLCLLTPLQYWLTGYLHTLRQRMCDLTERRLRLMADLLAGMKVIKMNCWEKPFSALIRTARSAEYLYIRTITHCLGLHTAITMVTGKLLVFGTLTLYLMMGYQVTPSVLFTVMSLCEIVKSSVCDQWPWSVRSLQESRAAVTNIQAFLLLDERNTVEVPAQLSLLKRSPLPENIMLRLEDYTASWEKDKNNRRVTLDSLNFSVHKGQLVVITGQAGSGKTSILDSVLGEIPRLGGFVRSRGRVGFVPQTNWVFSATFRENVMFGMEMDRRKYNKVLYACGLVKDLDTLPYNDLTPLGERGVTLTLAQKAKVGLARAVYQGADLYMVDDVFSCIDDKDSSHIFTKCFCGLISTKTIVLITHKLKFLKAADQIICLKQGKVEHQGTYSDLKKKGVNFKHFLPDLEQEDLSANQNERHIPAADNSEATSMRQKLWLDHFYSSDEALDKIWLQFEDSSDSDLLAPEDDLEPSPGASWNTYWQYLCVGGGMLGTGLLCVFFVLTQVSYVLCDWFLYHWSRSHWLSSVHYGNGSHDNHSSSSSSDVSIPPTNPPLFVFVPTPPHPTFYPYLGLFLGFLFCVFTRGTVFSGAVSRFSRRIHEHVFRSLLRATMAFFEKNTSGSILSRFGRDLGYVDDSLPASLFDVVQFQLLALATLVVMAAANYWLLIAILPVCALFVYGRHKFISTARELRRLESNTQGSVYQHLSHTVEGMWTLRAFSMEDKFLRYFDVYMDRHTAAAHLYLAINRWFSLRMDLLSMVLVSLLAFVSVAVHTYTAIHPGLLGLAMLYTVQMLGLAQCSVRQAVEVDHQMCGVERLFKYRSLSQEGALMTPLRPAPTWPQYGIVTLEGVSLQGVGEEAGRVLRNVWCCFRSEEKVGIISRPDGCKRALVASILRLCDWSGSLRIDGLDVGEIGLQDLRNKVSVIPMEPSLFVGSMRRNLDPYSRHPDAHLWRALELVQLKDKVEALPGKMYAEMCDYGNNFSLGERQLVCVARVILRPSKVLIFEETPSIISPRCERLIHHLLHTKFQNSTVLIVAHRLHSIIDTDRVMVLLDGRVKEFDPPHTLLQNPKTQLSRMVSSLGEHRAKLFRDIAKDRHDNKPYMAPPESLGGEGLLPYAGHRQSNRAFLPSFHNNRLSGVLSQFGSGKLSVNKY